MLQMPLQYKPKLLNEQECIPHEQKRTEYRRIRGHDGLDRARTGGQPQQGPDHRHLAADVQKEGTK